MIDKRKKKFYLKLNIMSLLFAVVPMISVTLAWFAYSGIVDTQTDVGVKAWYIDFQKNDNSVSNDIVLSLTDIYPGMDKVSEEITIKNLGDSDANLKYIIKNVRILSDPKDEFNSEDTASEVIEDKLSHDYPFSININVSKAYLKSKDEDAKFEVSINWPLDSGNDKLDSLWGTRAYNFEQEEKNKKEKDNSYQIKSAIKVVINVTAEQATKNEESIDNDFLLGNEILYDFEKDQICDELSNSCLKTYVIDNNNKIKDEYVTLMADLNTNLAETTYSNLNATYNNLTSTWKSNNSILDTKSLLKLISTDINNSYIKRPNISDKIIGKVLTDNRANSIINYAKKENYHFQFNNDNYPYLKTSNCIWTIDEYNSNESFALSNNKLGNMNKNEVCKVIPVAKVLKSRLKIVL